MPGFTHSKHTTFVFLLLLNSCAVTSSRETARSNAEASAEVLVEEKGSTTKTEAIADLASVTVDLKQVSSELGIPLKQLNEQISVLEKFLNSKAQIPAGYCVDEKESTEKLCRLMNRYSQSTDAEGTKRNTRASHAKFNPSQISSLQNSSLDQARRALRPISSTQTLEHIEKILETASCPRNLSTAALRELEGQLPEIAAQNAIEKLYTHATECLKPSDEGFEITHLRQALLRQLWGNKASASESIRLALRAEQSRERARTLYWAGKLLSDNKKNEYWARLVSEHPLSFHSLEVMNAQQSDPFQIISQRPMLQLSREIIGSDDAHESIRWLEALYIKEHKVAAEKLSLWIGLNHRNNLSLPNMMYLSSLKSQKGTTLGSIRFITSRVVENTDFLNQQTLTMLFPRPYFELFDKSSEKTDVFLLLAVARQESAFNPRARSPANAQGMLQILPGTARILSGRKQNDLYNPAVNVPLGAKFITQLIDRFGSVELALAGYNAGPGRVPQWLNRYTSEDPILFMDLIPFRETRDYVANILRNNYWYHRLYGEDIASNEVLANSAPNQGHQSKIVSRLLDSHRKIALQHNDTLSAR